MDDVDLVGMSNSQQVVGEDALTEGGFSWSELENRIVNATERRSRRSLGDRVYCEILGSGEWGQRVELYHICFSE